MSTNTYLAATPCVPKSLLIDSITQTNPMNISVTEDNTYIIGQLIHLTVPYTYGMYQADGLNCKIINIDSSGLIFSVNVDATNFDPFVAPPMYALQPASLSSAGSHNVYNFTLLPFHSLTNTGN